MAIYKDFIPENTAPIGVKRIGIYNAKGNRVGFIPLGNLARPEGKKLYSFGALSDVHLQYNTAQDDFKRALTYLNEKEDVAFTCIAGDLTALGTVEELQEYKNYVDTHSSDTPVYAITGNHDSQNGVHSNITAYTGQPLYYTFECGKDLFIMLGMSGGFGGLYTTEALQWLYETLEANRNRRCFVFHHVFPWEGCGNALGLYPNNYWGETEAIVFNSLMAHYKNAHQFHGHSHLKFYLQYGSAIANIDHIFGGWSVHIPSLAVTRDADPTEPEGIKGVEADSEGYVVDVYANGIHLRGRDFVKGEFLPIASYWLDTTLQTVEEGTYTDSTGTIVTKTGVNLASLAKVDVLDYTSATTHSRDGFKWYIDKKDAHSGLYFIPDELTVGETYTFSYKFQKAAGTLVGVGGHHACYTQVEWYLDGVKQTIDYSSTLKVTDDTNVHTVSFTCVYTGKVGDANLYFQPNRGSSSTPISCYIWDVKMEKGSTATPWIPAPGDA